MDIEDNVEISAMRMQCCEVRYDGATVSRQFGPITVKRNAELGFHVVIESNVIIEEIPTTPRRAPRHRDPSQSSSGSTPSPRSSSTT